jgi:hypothetical protein
MKTRLLNERDEAILRAAEDDRSGGNPNLLARRRGAAVEARQAVVAADGAAAPARITALNPRAIYTRRQNDVSRARAAAAEGCSISDPQTIYQARARKMQGAA